MATITAINACPYAPGSNRAERFALFKVGMDEAAHQAAGGRGKDWRRAVESGAIVVDGQAVAVGRAPRAPRAATGRAATGPDTTTEEGGLAEPTPQRAAGFPPTIPKPPPGLLPDRHKVRTCGYRKSSRVGRSWDEHLITCTDELGDRFYRYEHSEGLAHLAKDNALKYGIILDHWTAESR